MAFADSLIRPCGDAAMAPSDGEAPELAALFDQLPREGACTFGPPLRGAF